MDDAALLHAYARDRDQAAFAELVRRHVDLVHTAALRRTGGDARKAQEVTQQVFIDLAKKAAALAGHPALAAWLHRSTRFAAANLHREELRRRANEANAAREADILAATSEPAADWMQFAPVLDDALDNLGEADRQAVVLRYFSNLPFAEIGATLHVSEAAAQMRAARALEKLRRALAKHGVTSTASALGLALGTHAVTAAPASVATGALAAVGTAGAATTTTATGGLGLFSFINASTKLTLGVTAAGLVLGGAAWFAHTPRRTADKGPPHLPTHRPEERSQTPATKPLPTSPTARAAVGVNQATSAATPALPLPASPFPSSELRAWRDEAARRRVASEPGKSLFKNEHEAGLYIAYLNRLALEFERDFPTGIPPEDSVAHDDYTGRLAALQSDADLLLADGVFENTVVSRDPARIAALQTAYVAATLGLDSAQHAALGALISSAYTNGFARGLSLDRMPDGDTRAWEAGRAGINADAIAKARALLTPAQRALYDRLGWDRSLIFHLKAGPGFAYATGAGR